MQPPTDRAVSEQEVARTLGARQPPTDRTISEQEIARTLGAMQPPTDRAASKQELARTLGARQPFRDRAVSEQEVARTLGARQPSRDRATITPDSNLRLKEAQKDLQRLSAAKKGSREKYIVEQNRILNKWGSFKLFAAALGLTKKT